MTTEISFAGFTTNPSDHDAPDGHLALALNLANDDGGSLEPLRPGVDTGMHLEPGYTVVYIHKGTDYTHYIVRAGSSLRWFSPDSSGSGDTVDTQEIAGFSFDTYSQITSVGNSLMVLCPDGIHYILWKSHASGYVYLGNSLPEPILSFGLQGELVRDGAIYTASFTDIPAAQIYWDLPDTQKEEVSNAVMGSVNLFIRNATRQGRFIFPFFVRYALRLYDGTLTRHSPPCLMLCSTGVTPFVSIYSFGQQQGGAAISNIEYRIHAMLHTLDYALIDPSGSVRQQLQDWSDIVRSVDIFVSAPICAYDYSGQCLRFSEAQADLRSARSVCLHTNRKEDVAADYPARYQATSLDLLVAYTHSEYDATTHSFSGVPSKMVVLPSKKADAIKEEMRSVCNFYKLKSLKVDELSTSRTPVPISEDYLDSLTSRELMTGDDNHERYIPSSAFPYNSRLNISGLRRRLFEGFDAYRMFAFTNGYVAYYADDGADLNAYTKDAVDQLHITVYMKDGSHEVVVANADGYANSRMPLLFFYHPNSGAYKAVLRYGTSGQQVTLPLEPHSFLSGAFYFAGWEEPAPEPYGAPPALSPQSDLTVEAPARIMVSEVNNPFIFPDSKAVTIGSGNVLAISAAAKAMSQGQFGQFPLYAFTDEGVWALEVGSSGSYSARQPITRDVLLEGSQPLQIDSAVIFPTSRGLMHLAGSQCQCITPPIDSQYPFLPLSLPALGSLMAPQRPGGIPAASAALQPFLTFLRGCGMLYDYLHQRIVVYNPEFPYAYVRSLQSGLWSTMQSDIAYGLNSYPSALAVSAAGNLVEFASDEGEALPGIAVTRPLSLGAPDAYKTVDTVITRGLFARGHVASVLYGSRDLRRWHIVASSKDHYLRGFSGSPYKFFRLALLMRLSPGESVSSATVQFTPRLAGRPR